MNGRPPSRIRVGKCMVDLELCTMFADEGTKVPLTAMEFDRLRTPIMGARRVLTRDLLLELAHRQRWDPFDSSIDIIIGNYRR